MEFTYYGGNCVLISTKKLKVLVDPISGEYGPDPKLKPDVILYTQPPKADAGATADTTITYPGEYEIKTVSIEGIAARLHAEESADRLEGVIYRLTLGDVRAVVCGNIYPELTEEQLEQLDGVDVLIVPVGNYGLTLDKEAAASFVRQFNPGTLIPVHYNDGAVDYPMPQADVDDFLHEVGVSSAEPQDSLKVTSRDLSEETQFVVLKPRQ